MIFKNCFFLALCQNILFLLLYLGLARIQYGSLDDYFMSSVLTGAYGGVYDVHMYFVNAAYGYFLQPFYCLFPKVGWYFIFELLGTLAAFTAISYFLILRQGRKWGSIISILLLSSLVPDFYFQLSFTQCATLYTAAGLLSVFMGVSDNKKRFLAMGGVFLIAGSVMRHEGLLLGMPYLFLLFLVKWPPQKIFTRKNVIAVFLIVASIYGLREYDRNLYVDDGYKYYAQYQPIRSFFADGGYYDRESTYDELEEREMFGHDFLLLKSWVFYDTEVLQRDSLIPFMNVAKNNLYELNFARMPVEFLLAVSNALTRTNGLCWVILCLLLILSGTNKAALYPWASFGVIAISVGYLLLVNRLVYHVESGIWLYANVLAIPFFEKDGFRGCFLLKKWDKLLCFAFVLISLFFLTIGIANQPNLKKEVSLIESVQTPQKWKDFFVYAKENQDKVFILSFEKYKEMGEIRNPPYVAVGAGEFNNIFSWGYWNIHLPAMKKELAKRGVENPIHDIVHDNVYLMEDKKGPLLGLFYEEHYHQKLVVDTVKAFDNLILIKYRMPQSVDEASHE